MAIIECKECQGKVSTEAAACPHCGAKMPRPRVWPKVIGAVIAVPVLLFGFELINVIINGPNLKAEAESQCQDAISSILKSPSSASFSDTSASKYGDGYMVRGSVDAQNGFGASIRSTFTCEFDKDANGHLVRQGVCVSGLVPGGTC